MAGEGGKGVVGNAFELLINEGNCFPEFFLS